MTSPEPMTTPPAGLPPEAAQCVLCGNEDHQPPVPAVVRVEWPGGWFKPNTACEECLEMLLHLYVLPGHDLIGPPHAVTVTPVEVSP